MPPLPALRFKIVKSSRSWKFQGSEKREMSGSPKKLNLVDLIIAFLFPTLVGKSLVLYFGLNYSNYPGEGYGVGLALSILFTICMVGRFIWKYWDYED